MSAKKSVVKNVQGNGTWQNKEGKEFYKYEVTMENGDAGEYSSISDSQNKFTKDQEVEYIFSGGEFPKIKPYYSHPINSTGSNYKVEIHGNEAERIARSVALKTATEFGIYQGLELQEVLETAKIMADFIIKDIKTNG
jgi:hypothetical protein